MYYTNKITLPYHPTTFPHRVAPLTYPTNPFSNIRRCS